MFQYRSAAISYFLAVTALKTMYNGDNTKGRRCIDFIEMEKSSKNISKFIFSFSVANDGDERSLNRLDRHAFVNSQSLSNKTNLHSIFSNDTYNMIKNNIEEFNFPT